MNEIMTEKELLIEMITDYDVDLILSALNESIKIGKPEFKKMKVKMLLNKSSKKSSKASYYDFLSENIKTKPYENLAYGELMARFREANPSEVPLTVQFFTLKKHYPDFFSQHFDKMVQNVSEKKYFLEGLNVFETEEEVSQFYLQKYGDSELAVEAIIESVSEWHIKNIGPLDQVESRLKGCSLLEYETKLPQLKQEFSEVTLQVALLKVGVIPDEVRKVLSQKCLREFLVYKQKHDKKLLTEEKENISLKLKDMTKRYKELMKQAKVQEQETKEALSLLEKENQSLNNEIQGLTQQIQVLESRIKEQEILTAGYVWGLSADYSPLGLVVIHASQLLYAKHIFPDIDFLFELDEHSLTRTPKQMFVQKYGIPYSQKRQIQQYAAQKGLLVTELNGREERELIIELSQHLKIKGVQ